MKHIPYTVLLFLVGVLMGYTYRHTKEDNYLGTLTYSIELWSTMDPHLMLFSFLPALLFGDSMGINWHDFKRTAAQCFLLAGPGVLLGTFFMYLPAKYVLPYGWELNECAAFASILAATDPVAVVGLLKEMGASRTLTMQIAGESLLNDGMAIVVWLVFYDLIDGKKFSTGGVIGSLFQLALGGIVFGVFIGIIALYWVAAASDKLNHSHHLIQVALTVTVAYLAFFIGENELKVSGVLSTLFAALVLGRTAWPLFCSQEGIEHVWHAIEFFGNTVLFVLTGVVFELAFESTEWKDLGWLMVLYVLAMVSRGLMILILYPFLNMVTHSHAAQTSWKECLVMTWGGLRGAVGLALAMATKETLHQRGRQRVGDLMVFFVGGIAGLTLLINATTCGILLKKLGLTKPFMARTHLLKSLQHELHSRATRFYHKLSKTDDRFRVVRRDMLAEFGAVPSGSDSVTMDSSSLGMSYSINQMKQASERELSSVLVCDKPSGASQTQERCTTFASNPKDHWWWGFNAVPTRDKKSMPANTDPETLMAEREMFLSMLKAEYNNQIRNGMLPELSYGTQHLLRSVDAARDFTFIGLMDWKILLSDLFLKGTGVHAWVNRWLHTFFQMFSPTFGKAEIFDLFALVGFLDAHHIVCAELTSKYLKEQSPARRHIVEESGAELEAAHKFLVESGISVPQIKEVRTRQMAVAILLHQKTSVDEWHEHGIISAAESEELLQEVHHALRCLETNHANHGSCMGHLPTDLKDFYKACKQGKVYVPDDKE